LTAHFDIWVPLLVIGYQLLVIGTPGL
jgi:hypothetical protein